MKRQGDVLDLIYQAWRIYVVVELSPGIQSTIECNKADLIEELVATYTSHDMIWVEVEHEAGGIHLYVGRRVHHE